MSLNIRHWREECDIKTWILKILCLALTLFFGLLHLKLVILVFELFCWLAREILLDLSNFSLYFCMMNYLFRAWFQISTFLCKLLHFCHDIVENSFCHVMFIVCRCWRLVFSQWVIVCHSSEEWKKVSKSEREKLGVTVQDDGEFWWGSLFELNII